MEEEEEELKFVLNIAVLKHVFFCLVMCFSSFTSRRAVWWKRSAASKAEVSFTFTPTGFFIGSEPDENRCLYTSGRVVLSCGCLRTLSKGIS